MIEIRLLTRAMITQGVVKDINDLLLELSSNARRHSAKALKRIVGNEDTKIYCAFDDDRVVAIGAIYFREELCISRTAWVADIVTNENYRRRGLSRKINSALIEEARKRGIQYVALYSYPQAKAANNLYLSLGYKKRDINFFRLTLYKS